MADIKVHDKTFIPFLEADKIQHRVEQLGRAISRDYKDRTPLFIGVLNGAFMFCSDLVRAVDIDVEVTFVRLSSYNGMDSSGRVRHVMGLRENVKNRDLIIVEDIVDSGLTMEKALDYFKSLEPASVTIASLLLKPECLKCDLHIEYTGFEIPEKFVVGYGLDYDGLGRNFKDIYQLKPE